MNQAVLAVTTMNRVENNSAILIANRRGKSLRVEFHKLDVVVLRLERVSNRFTRAPRNFSLSGRAATYDDNFLPAFFFEHF